MTNNSHSRIAQVAGPLVLTAVLTIPGAPTVKAQGVRQSPPQPAHCIGPASCQEAARAALDAELARTGRDCPDAHTQQDENACVVEAHRITMGNYVAFSDALKRLVGDAILHESESAWVTYRGQQCAAVYRFFYPGTIASAAQVRCQIDLTRQHMKDLDRLFEQPLHH